MSKKSKYESALEEAQKGLGDPAAENSAVDAPKRKRRNATELFAAQKQELADAVVAARAAAKQAEDDLQAAIQAEIDFVDRAKAALGL